MTHSPHPEAGADFATLIVAVADGDKRAFVELFEFFAPRVKTLLIRLGASPALAEELAQEAMVTVWHKAKLFDPAGASASGWVYRIAKNLHIDTLRRENKLAEIVRGESFELPQHPDVIAETREMERRVRAALLSLNPEQYQVVALSFFEEKPHAVIAGQLNIPLGTVKSRLRLAMRRLRSLLDADA